MQLVSQLSPRIRVLVYISEWLLNEENWSRDFFEGLIYEGFAESNEAMTNSNIDVKFDVVFISMVSAEVEQAQPRSALWWYFCVAEAMCRWFVEFVSLVDADGRSCAKFAENMYYCCTRLLNVSSNDETDDREGDMYSINAATSGACHRMSKAPVNAALRRQPLLHDTRRSYGYIPSPNSCPRLFSAFVCLARVRY